MRKKQILLWSFGIVTILVIIGVIVVFQFSGNMTDVIVDVKIVDHEIVEIDILKHINGQGGAAETIVDDVITQQTLLVDTITGATYSSKVILKAISNALD